MNYSIFPIMFTVVVITTFTILTINAWGQSSNSTLQEEQIFNKTEPLQQPSEQQDQALNNEIIKVSSSEFNQLLNEIKGSINLIQGRNMMPLHQN